MRNRLLWIFIILAVIGVGLYALGVRQTKLHIEVAAEPVFCLFGEKEGLHCASGFPVTNSLIVTVLADLLLALTIFFGARNMQLIPRGFQNIAEFMVESFYNFAQSVDRRNVAKFFPICATIFFLVLYANVLGLVPGVGSIGTCTPAAELSAEEVGAVEGKPADFFANWPGYCGEGFVLVPWLRAPSADLNMTLAVALVSFTMTEVFGLQALGLSYLTKFFNFREGAMGFVIGILELISEFVRIIAFAFRLFGNIFAGEVVLVVMSFLFPYLLPLPFYAFELFVAFIQAVIFATLTLVFMTLAVQAHGAHDEHGHVEAPMPIEAGDVPGHGGSH
jgi:F-type H+-transporting ATPase subunit a